MNIRPHHIIAEIGTSHGGSIAKAKELVDAAKESGATTAKFQWVIADEIVSPSAGHITLPNGDINIYKKFQEVEQGILFYDELQKYCNQKDILFLCSIFGLESLQLLNELHPQCIKIASPEVNYLSLLSKIPTHIPHVLLSDGISTHIDIARCMEILKNPHIHVLHCITQYPAPIEMYQLSRMLTYKQMFNCDIGISDHTTHPFLLPALATLLGSTCTEKHFTLHKNGQGLDDTFALAPQEFALMSEVISYASQINISSHDTPELTTDVINGMKKILSCYSPRTSAVLAQQTPVNESSLSALIKNMYDSAGNSPAFLPIYFTTRRSSFTSQAIQKNQIIDEDNHTHIRSETNLQCGASSEYINYLQRSISDNQKITARNHVNKHAPLHLTDIKIQE